MTLKSWYCVHIVSLVCITIQFHYMSLTPHDDSNFTWHGILHKNECATHSANFHPGWRGWRPCRGLKVRPGICSWQTQLWPNVPCFRITIREVSRKGALNSLQVTFWKIFCFSRAILVQKVLSGGHLLQFLTIFHEMTNSGISRFWELNFIFGPRNSNSVQLEA